MSCTRLSTLLLPAHLASCASRSPAQRSAADAHTRTLRIASWNLEFLAEKSGSGCHPRQDADYAHMKRIADSLGADVVAFEQVENPAAAARVSDPKRYTIVMEQRPGKPGGSCGCHNPGHEKIGLRRKVVEIG